MDFMPTSSTLGPDYLGACLQLTHACIGVRTTIKKVNAIGMSGTDVNIILSEQCNAPGKTSSWRT